MRRIGIGLVLFGVALAQGFKEDLRATVEPLLLGLAGGTEVLAEAAEAYAGGPTTEGLNRLRLLWLAARSPWEELEAFAFGPVGEFDPYLDTWSRACLANRLAPRRRGKEGEKNPKAVGDQLQRGPRHGRPRLPLHQVSPT